MTSQATPEEKPKVKKEEVELEIRQLYENIVQLPPYTKIMPITHYDMEAILSLLLAILRSE